MSSAGVIEESLGALSCKTGEPGECDCAKSDQPARNPDRRRRDAAAIRTEAAGRLALWRRRNRFYHDRIIDYLRFNVPENESVLLLGCEDGELLTALSASRGLGIDSSPEMIAQAKQHHRRHRYLVSADYRCEPGETFEYIILNDVTGEVRDLFTLFQNIRKLCTETSRIVLVQNNYRWRPILRAAAWMGAKRQDAKQNWLSVGDLRGLLDGAGLETINVQARMFCPKKLLGLGPVVNWAAGFVPLVRGLASTQILVARPVVRETNPSVKTATIVLTTRNERDNIEPLVRAIPDVGAETEILFVEGHSTDGTREEIQRVIRACPERDIGLLVQDGVGQGDAIRKGFSQAKGDVIILLEADLTSPPEDVLKAFDIVASGRADYVNGSRFIYPRSKGAMPLRNVLGNWLFAIWFTWFLGQRTSDVLCGLKAIDRRWFSRLVQRWGFLGVFDPFGDFELLFGAARLGLKIYEVPTRYTSRTYGKTKSMFFRHGLKLARMAGRSVVVFRCR